MHTTPQHKRRPTSRRRRRIRHLARLEQLENRLLLAADAFEPNDSFAQAFDLGTDDQTLPSLSIHESFNDDWYKWAASANGTLDVDIEFRHETGDLDLELYNASERRLDFSDSLTDNESLSADVVAGQAYFIRVLGFNGAFNSYDMIVDGPSYGYAPDQFEPNDSFAQAVDLGSGDQIHQGLTVHKAYNDDWYAWTASDDGLLVVDTIFANANGDLDLELYDSGQNRQAFSGTQTDNEQISFNVSAGQSYYIRVYGFDGALNTYDLRIDGPDVSSDIIDNGASGFSTVGDWTLGTNSGFLGDMHYARDASADVARWTFHVTPGHYRVSATWPASPNRATDSPFTVRDGSSILATVDINQEKEPDDFTAEGASWEDLGGTYNITGSTLIVELSDDANEYVIADAIRIDRVEAPQAPEIVVLDGATNIPDAGTIQFGSTRPNVAVNKTLVVRNVGTKNLTLTPLNPASFPAGFSLVSNFSSTNLAPDASATFAVRLLSASQGFFSGTVSFGNNDTDENPFDISLSGRVELVSQPEIQVLDGTSNISDGGTVSFGATQPNVAVEKTLKVSNVGTQNLVLSSLNPSSFPTGFSLVTPFGSSTLNPGASTTFTIGFKPSGQGNFGGSISFGNNDADENPFDLVLAGSGGPPAQAVQIIDDGADGFSTVGSWTRGIYSGLGGDMHYARDASGDVARWKFDVTPGQYRVSATWPERANRATDSPFTIRDGNDILATVDVNQEKAPNDFTADGASWEDLGGPYNITGTALVVELSDDANEYVIADAIRIEKIVAPVETPEIVVLDGTTNIPDTGTIEFGTTQPNVPVNKTLVVRNVGTKNLALTPLDPAGFPAGFSLVSNFSSTNLAPGASATFSVRLRSSSEGDFDGTISFGNNDTDENPFDISLSGHVEPAPQPEIQVLDGASNISDGGTVSFGTTQPNVAVQKTLKVSNVGTQNLVLSSLNPGSFPTGFSLVTPFSSSILIPGASTTFTIGFKPSAQGDFGGSISFGNNDADENPFDLVLAGSGGPPAQIIQIIDDGEGGFSTVGSWRHGDNHGVAGDMHYARDASGDVARWRFDVTPGRYRVSATWPAHRNRATDSPFTIRDGNDILVTVDVNQEKAPNDLTADGESWADLGSSHIITGSTLVVELSDDANEYVIADAIRIERIGPV